MAPQLKPIKAPRIWSRRITYGAALEESGGFLKGTENRTVRQLARDTADHLKMHLAILAPESDRVGAVCFINIEVCRMVEAREKPTT
jgi:hypothetical protein